MKEIIDLTKLSDEKLFELAKKNKSTKNLDALLIGSLVGIAAYSTYFNGIGLFTFLPLIYFPVAAKNKAKNKELQAILKQRNLI